VTLAPGSRLGPYEITARLGVGGMGEVWRARDSRLGREVAVKVLPPEVAGDAERLRRFEQEARAASALNHPGILTVHDFGSEGGVAYLVTELLEGESLRERLRRGPLPERKALELGAETARALAIAHAKGIVHRDLKPENLFLTADGRIKILDFGLARWTPPTATGGAMADATTIAGLTEAGTVLGTVGYMAPEQARGLPVDARADLFALGCVVYEMLAGQRAFERASAVDTLSAILTDDPLAAVEADAALPEETVRVLRHCLEKEPSRRFQTASDVAFAFDSLRQGSRPRSHAVAEPSVRVRRPWTLPLAVAAAFAVVTALVVWRFGSRDAGAPEGAAPRISSIAVLPFVNERGVAELDYLGDGLAESLIGKLSPLPELKVLARSTVFRFRGPDVDPLAVGRQLGVGAVLSGRVDQRDERLVVGAELVDVASGAQLWGERFNRTAADLFAIEEEVAHQIADKLALRLGARDEARLAARPTDSDEAYRLYLRGRHLWNQRTRESVQESLGLFQEAIALDPEFALAWIGLADAYVVGWAGYVNLPFEEAFARGEQAVRRALELDDSLPEAHVSLAVLLFERQWDWTGAEREFRRAVELDPGDAYAHQAFGELLYCLGRFEESRAELARALELDPLSLIVRSVIGWEKLARGDAEDALAEFHGVLAVEPGFLDALAGVPLALRRLGRPEAEEIAAYLDIARATGLESAVVERLRRTYERDGAPAFWRTMLEIQLGPQRSAALTKSPPSSARAAWVWSSERKTSSLGREVALKVLPEGFTAGSRAHSRGSSARRSSRQLNHPNIAQIYGSKRAARPRPRHGARRGADPGRAIGVGKSLPLDESLSIARQIAEALEEAHEKGIIHRDLKPQNIKASIEGKVKVLDFGLAKAMDPAGASGGAVGLAARGVADADARRDGAGGDPRHRGVHEPRAGEGAGGRRAGRHLGVRRRALRDARRRRLFAGDSVPEVLAGVLKREIDFDALPAATPPAAPPAPPPLPRAQSAQPPARHRRRPHRARARAATCGRSICRTASGFST
jgi:eukaryotic-like serine/threonine-protein kinase